MDNVDNSAMEFKKKKHIFVVSIECSQILEDKVVENYVSMALKKYDKLNFKERGMQYFDGLWSPPAFSVKKVQVEMLSEKEDLVRDSVRLVKEVQNAVGGLTAID